MYSVKFSYKEHKHNFMPIIPLILFGKNSNLITEGYVDSGALYSIFAIELINALNLNTSNSRRQMFVVGDGSFIPAYIFKMYMQIGDKKFLSEIAFSNKLNIGFNLIGRKGVFNKFDEIIFREKKKEIEFRININFKN